LLKLTGTKGSFDNISFITYIAALQLMQSIGRHKFGHVQNM